MKQHRGSSLAHLPLTCANGSFCETDGPGTGAPLTAHGTATLVGTKVETTFERFACGNGRHGTFDPPLPGSAELTPEGLNVEGYYVAVRAGG